MPTKDIFHDAVRHALEKDDWQITNDPLIIQSGGIDFYIDLGAEKIIAAEKEGQKIAVEIKSFSGPSLVYEFHTALGQFINYRLALKEQEPDRRLFLAVPSDVYEAFFSLPFTQTIIKRYQLKLIVYKIKEEVIIKWKK